MNCFQIPFDYSQHTFQTTWAPCICCVLAKNSIIFSATSDLTFYETYFVDLWVVRFSKEGHLLRESWMRMHNDSYFVTPTSISKKKRKKTRQKVGFYYQLVHFIIMYHLSVGLGMKTFQEAVFTFWFFEETHRITFFRIFF